MISNRRIQVNISKDDSNTATDGTEY